MAFFWGVKNIIGLDCCRTSLTGLCFTGGWSVSLFALAYRRREVIEAQNVGNYIHI